jgi:hypothetical protein
MKLAQQKKLPQTKSWGREDARNYLEAGDMPKNRALERKKFKNLQGGSMTRRGIWSERFMLYEKHRFELD